MVSSQRIRECPSPPKPGIAREFPWVNLRIGENAKASAKEPETG